MIVFSKHEQYDGSWRIVLYDVDRDGKCRPEFTKPELDDHIGSYYLQRAIEFERLQKDLFDRKISPLGFFMKYHNMDVTDLAARTELRKSAVKRHLTPDGFSLATVEALKRYARVFDIGVADFFEFTCLPDGFSVSVERFDDRLIQKVAISAGPSDREGRTP